jgi:hypothetical protein
MKDVMADAERSDDVEQDEVVGIEALPEDEVIPEDIDEGIEDDESTLDADDYGEGINEEELDDDQPGNDDDAVAGTKTDEPEPARGRRGTEGEDEEEDEDEVDDDVEADLDTILKDRIAAQPEEADEDEEEQPEPEERGDGPGRLQPRQPGEFVCQSCFLVKHPSQLADPEDMLCADCV